MDFVANNQVTEMDRQAMDMFYRNFCAVLKRNSQTYDQLAMLESMGRENFGLMSLGCLDTTDRGYINFINLMNEYGIPYVEQRISVKDSSYESVYIALNRNDIDIAESLRIEALKKSINFRVSLDADIACDKIAKSDKITDKSIVTVTNLNLYEKELLKIKCQNISPAFNLYETEKTGDDGLTFYDITLRDSKIMNINDKKNDFCKAYLQTLFGLYGYNSNHIIEHLNADIEVQLSLEENKDTNNTFYIVGANERRIKHYIEINPNGFQMYVSTMKNGKRFDAEMQPLDKYKCCIESEEYEEKLQAALNQLPSKTVLTTSRELNEHLKSIERNIESTQPSVSIDEKIVAERERQIVELIDRAIKERLNNADEYRFLKSGQEKFSYYINDTRNIISACINRSKPVDYDSSLIMTINAMAEQVGMNVNAYQSVLEAIDTHKVSTSMAMPKENNKEINISLKNMAKNIEHNQNER